MGKFNQGSPVKLFVVTKQDCIEEEWVGNKVLHRSRTFSLPLLSGTSADLNGKGKHQLLCVTYVTCNALARPPKDKVPLISRP